MLDRFRRRIRRSRCGSRSWRRVHENLDKSPICQTSPAAWPTVKRLPRTAACLPERGLPLRIRSRQPRGGRWSCVPYDVPTAKCTTAMRWWTSAQSQRARSPMNTARSCNAANSASNRSRVLPISLMHGSWKALNHTEAGLASTTRTHTPEATCSGCTDEENADAATPDEQTAERPQDGDPAQPRPDGWNGIDGHPRALIASSRRELYVAG